MAIFNIKSKIEKIDEIINILDGNNNLVYFNDGEGSWIKMRYDNKGNEIYYENNNSEIKNIKILGIQNLLDFDSFRNLVSESHRKFEFSRCSRTQSS